MFQFDQVVIDMIWKGIRETLFMTLMSTLMGYVLGLPLGIALAVTDKGGIHPNRVVYRILDVIMYLIPFFGKRKRDRVVREVRYHTTCKEVCKVKTTEREKEHEKD